MLPLMLSNVFSLLDRGSLIFMLLLMQAKLFSLLDKDFMLLFGSIRSF